MYVYVVMYHNVIHAQCGSGTCSTPYVCCYTIHIVHISHCVTLHINTSCNTCCTITVYLYHIRIVEHVLHRIFRHQYIPPDRTILLSGGIYLCNIRVAIRRNILISHTDSGTCSTPYVCCYTIAASMHIVTCDAQYDVAQCDTRTM